MVPGAVRDRAVCGARAARRICDDWNCRGGGWNGPGVPGAPDSAGGKALTPMAAPTVSEFSKLACIFFILLVPFAAAGLALMNVGLGRSRSAGHMMMASLCALAVAGLAYFVCGFAWQGFIGGPGHVLTLSGKSWN